MLPRVLRNRAFAIYLTGNTCSLHGMWIQRVASGWLAWELSHSAFWVGVVALSTFLPLLVLGPVFGALADRIRNTRRAAIVANAVQLCFAGALFVVTVCGWMTIELLCLLSMLNGAGQSAYQPIRMSLVHDMVEREDLARAIAITAIMFNLSRFLGPALAGIIIAKAGVAYAFAVNALSFLALLAALSLIRTRLSTVMPAKHSVFADLTSGVRYAIAHSTIRQQLLITASSALFGRGVLELLPAFADQVFKRGSSGLAVLSSAAGGGAIVASVVLSSWTSTERLQLLTVTGSIGAGLLLLALGASDLYISGIAAVAALAFCLTLCGTGSQALLQSHVADEFRGRIVSLWGMLTLACPAAGAVAIGAASHLVGLQITTLIVATISVACALLLARLHANERRQSAEAQREAAE